MVIDPEMGQRPTTVRDTLRPSSAPAKRARRPSGPPRRSGTAAGGATRRGKTPRTGCFSTNARRILRRLATPTSLTSFCNTPRGRSGLRRVDSLLAGPRFARQAQRAARLRASVAAARAPRTTYTTGFADPRRGGLARPRTGVVRDGPDVASVTRGDRHRPANEPSPTGLMFVEL